MKPKTSSYSLAQTGEFSIRQYHYSSPFASFFPGIAGEWGIPMWVFYVNRGQGIASFGVQDKDHPIMEFLPANRAWRLVSLQGFRTFIKIHQKGKLRYYEPFQFPRTHSTRVLQTMRIQPHELTIIEENSDLGLKFHVRYFTIPHEPFAALARILTITNLTSKKQHISIVDGMPALIPYGMTDWFIKHMSRTIEAWVQVDNLENKAPFYRLRVEPHDRPEVVHIDKGNFYFGFSENDGKTSLLTPIVDPAVLFGPVTDFSLPANFVCTPLRIPRVQHSGEKTPCAFGVTETVVQPGGAAAVYSLFGHMGGLEVLNTSLPRIRQKNFFAEKEKENQQLIQELTGPIAAASANPAWDAYSRQSYLDNVLRGGKPVVLGEKRERVFYIYSRKHGDLERDYNQFVIPATYFSQGNANYRDVNQNRRNDVWFYPEVKDQNVITFFNLIQPDGFNPLVFKGIRYRPRSTDNAPDSLKAFLSKPFTPGELLEHLAKEKISTGKSVEKFLNELLDRCEEIEDADHGEGFWTDHWTYNLDLLESYLAVYPEKDEEILLKKKVFTFYDNAFVVAPRSKKYALTDGKVRQYHSVYKDLEKGALIKARKEEPNKVRVNHGRGKVYKTTLAMKMITVIVNKLASLDPEGIGIEMEAEKPNWYDALNGLPGLFGSSVCETFELKRWIVFMKESLQKITQNKEKGIIVPEEVGQFISELDAILGLEAMEYWERSAAAKEEFREKTRLGFSGEEKNVSFGQIVSFLNRAQTKVEKGIEKAFDRKTKLYRSYFYYEVRGGEQKRLPLFLEGIVHALRVETDPKRAKNLYEAVRKSPLYDQKLGMYRICDSLLEEPEEIGRCRVFTGGWLEHQSIWLHMEYKYLLELLRAGLVDEFYQDIPKALIPFQPAKRYGRSPLENSSFLVSSAYPDPKLHGRGYVARLSGATAEFLNLWLWMVAGREPFFLNERNELNLRFSPILSKDFFTRNGDFEFSFLGKVKVHYHNPSRLPTYGKRPARPAQVSFLDPDGKKVEIKGPTIGAPYAEWIRQGRIPRIQVRFEPVL